VTEQRVDIDFTGLPQMPIKIPLISDEIEFKKEVKNEKKNFN
jgi:hypothetical protein